MKERCKYLEVRGLRCFGRGWPDADLEAGGVCRYPLGEGEDAEALMDAIFGILPLEGGSVRWFGVPLEEMGEKRICKNLRRVMPLVADGGLLANLPVCENVLLPAVVRKRRKALELEGMLYGLVEGGLFGHGKETLGLLPYQLTDLQRCSAGFLRALLCRPEVICFCDVYRVFDPVKEKILSGWLEEMRRRLPESAWLVIHSETGLPEVFCSGSVG